MAIVKCKPTSAGRRHVVKIVNPELHKGKPYAPLLDTKSKTGGRNNYGRITTRHIGGGHKQHYRLIDFKRNKLDIPAVVERLEYDPNRSANIALVLYKDGERRYILAPKGLSVGDQIQSGVNSPIKVGNSLPMRNIPVGSTVHNVELKPGKGGQIARSAGAYVQIIAREGNYVTLRLRSGEMRKVLAECVATIGEVGNSKCGDIMKMYIKVKDNTIVDVKFKTFGCGAAIATSSMATELIKGKSIDEALKLTNKAVMEALDGLPPVKVHCSVLAEQAIKAALADYYKRNGIDPTPIVGEIGDCDDCHCH